MPHEELRDHPDVAGILYMTGLCKQTLIWTHVHTHYQVTRSGIRAGRVRACACLHARLATAASHARRLAAPASTTVHKPAHGRASTTLFFRRSHA